MKREIQPLAEISYQKRRAEKVEAILSNYQKLYAYLLTKSWYTDHLPEIRKHVEEVINIK